MSPFRWYPEGDSCRLAGTKPPGGALNHNDHALRTPHECLSDGLQGKPRRGDGRLAAGEQPGGETVTEQELKKMLAMLRTEHRDLDAAIDALTSTGSIDQLQIARLKKRKLRLRDQIAIVEDQLLPDIIA